MPLVSGAAGSVCLRTAAESEQMCQGSESKLSKICVSVGGGAGGASLKSGSLNHTQ